MNDQGLQVANLIVQSGAVLAAVGAAIVALAIASRDRREAARQARLMIELDAALRLSANLVQGGTADNDNAAQLERKRMGAEAMALAGLLGPGRVPSYWDRRQLPDTELREKVADEATPRFTRDAAEAQLAVNTIMRELGMTPRERRQARRRKRKRRPGGRFRAPAGPERNDS